MHPSAYMPFYGNDFFGALEGYDGAIIEAYLRALWHYWHHSHCEGLPNDQEYLQRLCRANPTTWPKLAPVLFGRFFTLDPAGLWQQKRAQQEYEKVMATYEKRVSNGSAGARERWSRRANSRKTPRAHTRDECQHHRPDQWQHHRPDQWQHHRPDQWQQHSNQNQTHNQNNNQIQIQTQNPDPEQLNDELPPTPPNGPPKPDRSSAIRLEKDLMGQLQELLGEDEMARAGGHWRKNWVRTQPDLVARALADLRLQIRGRGPDFADCRAAWLTDLLKRWLPKSRPITGPAPRQPLEPAGAGPDITAPGSTLQENESTPENTYT